jgi:1,4-alpha-glucan branching enzyme
VTDLTGSGVRDAKVPLPRDGRWVEVLNTDALDYGGTGEGNLGAVSASTAGAVTVGPSATVWLIPG